MKSKSIIGLVVVFALIGVLPRASAQSTGSQGGDENNTPFSVTKVDCHVQSGLSSVVVSRDDGIIHFKEISPTNGAAHRHGTFQPIERIELNLRGEHLVFAETNGVCPDANGGLQSNLVNSVKKRLATVLIPDTNIGSGTLVLVGKFKYSVGTEVIALPFSCRVLP